MKKGQYSLVAIATLAIMPVLLLSITPSATADKLNAQAKPSASATPTKSSKPEPSNKPSDGSVGNATNSPGGQSSKDPNKGHECDDNNGVGQGNPAHPSCASTVTASSSPSVSTSASVTVSSSASSTVTTSSSPSTSSSASSSVSPSVLPSTVVDPTMEVILSPVPSRSVAPSQVTTVTASPSVSGKPLPPENPSEAPSLAPVVDPITPVATTDVTVEDWDLPYTGAGKALVWMLGISFALIGVGSLLYFGAKYRLYRQDQKFNLQ